MTEILNRHMKKIVIITLLVAATFLLTGCRGAAWQERPYTSWRDDWQLSGFFGVLFGWPIAILSFPFAALLSFVGSIFGGSFFWAIVFTTIIIRTVAWPIYTKNNNMQLKMQMMQPEIQALQAKYAHRTDPESKRRMQMEMANVYKKYKINPLGCVVTMFIQMPIFVTMFEVLRRVNLNTYTYIEGSTSQAVQSGRFAFANQNFFIFDLNASFNLFTPIQDFRNASAEGNLASIFFTIVVALLVTGVNFYQQRRSMAKANKRREENTRTFGGRDPIAPNKQQGQMKWMMILMPLMFFPMALGNAALGVYWLVGGLFTLFQHEIGARITDKKLAELNKQN